MKKKHFVVRQTNSRHLCPVLYCSWNNPFGAFCMPVYSRQLWCTYTYSLVLRASELPTTKVIVFCITA